MMQRIRTHSIFSLLMGIALLLVLGTNLPSNQDFIALWAEALLYLTMTILATALGVWLTEGEFSMAHAVGMLAFLSLVDEAALSMMTWGLFIGAILGNIVFAMRYYRQLASRRIRSSIYSVIASTARVTLSFYIAGVAFFAIGGTVPITTGDDAIIPLLLIYSIIYLTLYSVLFLIEMHIKGYKIIQILKNNLLEILFSLIMPVAFAVVGALIRVELPFELFGFVIAALILVIVVPFGYTRGQYLLRQQLHEIQTLSEFGQEIQKTTHLNTLLQLIENQITQLIQANYFILSILDHDTGKLTFPLIIVNGKVSPTQTIHRADKWLIEQTLEQEPPLFIEQNTTQYLQEHHITPHPIPVESWFGVRMIAGGHPNGALVVYTQKDYFLSLEETRLLRLIASTISTAIDNVQLYQNQQERVTRLNTLNTISVLLSSTLSPDSVLDSITTSASMLTEATGISVYLAPSTDSPAELVRSAGLSENFTQLAPTPLLESNHPKRSRSGDTSPLNEYPPLIVTEVNHDARTHHIRDILAKEGIQSFVEIPLINGDERIGAVGIYYTEAQRFRPEFIEFLRTFANEAVQAIRNAELYTTTDQALEQRLVQLSILAAVGQQANASMRIEDICETVLAYAIDYTKAKRGILSLLENTPPQWHIAAKFNYYQSSIVSQNLFQTDEIRQILDGRKHVYLDGIDTTIEGFRLSTESRSQLTVPILSNRAVVGFVLLESPEDQAFSDDDIQFILQLMTQTAIAIDNRKLFQTVVESRDRMQIILDTMTEGIILIDQRGYVILANPAVQLIGFNPDHIINQEITALLQQETSMYQRLGFESMGQFDQFFQQLQHGKTWKTISHHHYNVSGTHGELYIERQVIPIHHREDDQQVLGAMLVFYNQTEKRELDRTRDELTRMIVHDLRSPLTAVMTSIRVIEQIVPSDIERYPMVTNTTEAAEQALQKLLRRVDALLDIAKIESGELKLEQEPIALSAIVDSVFEELAPLANERSITLINQIHDDTPNAYADREKIERLIQNLVDNALKYTPSNTHVIIEAHPSNNDMLQVNIIDQGPGIPAEYKERLFDRFVQIQGRRGARRGVGLGLTFCRLVVDAHGGKIWTDDNPKGGSIFSFLLPVAHEKQKSVTMSENE